jgi:hypothetical protein
MGKKDKEPKKDAKILPFKSKKPPVKKNPKQRLPGHVRDDG